jgi:large subunit ribosomal protein L10Ae
MSKVSNDHMRKCISEVMKGAEEKKREFLETIELQIGLKNYDPQKDKRFAGNIKLPHIPRPKMKVCVLGDAYHCEKAASMGLDFKNAEGLKNFNKNKKLIKKFGEPPPSIPQPHGPGSWHTGLSHAR